MRTVHPDQVLAIAAVDALEAACGPQPLNYAAAAADIEAELLTPDLAAGDIDYLRSVLAELKLRPTLPANAR
jgi:hypothetical protein